MGRRRRSVMSDSFKYELAKDLGFYDTIQKEGWGGISTKDAGNMVKRAIQIAETSSQQVQQNRGAQQHKPRPQSQPEMSAQHSAVVSANPSGDATQRPSRKASSFDTQTQSKEMLGQKGQYFAGYPNESGSPDLY